MKLLKIDLDLIKIIQFWTFWTFLLKPPQPFAGLIYDLFYRVWDHDLLLDYIILNISTNSGWFYVKLSQQGSFLWDNRNTLSLFCSNTILAERMIYLRKNSNSVLFHAPVVNLHCWRFCFGKFTSLQEDGSQIKIDIRGPKFSWIHLFYCNKKKYWNIKKK